MSKNKSVPKRTLVILVSVLICIALLFSQYFHRQLSQPSTSSSKGNLVLSSATFTTQKMTEVIPTTTMKDNAGNKMTEVIPTTIMKDNASEDLLIFWSIMNRSYVEDHLVRPRVGDHVCEDVLCSEFLTQEDLKRMDWCAKKLINNLVPTPVPSCHFMNGTSSQMANVALISFPGSGNTWIRGLLEKATGICTGSLYCDVQIWMSGSVGESINSGSVLVVKTHSSLQSWVEQKCSNPNSYKAAIFILRNPYDALVSGYKWVVLSSYKNKDPHTMEVDSMFGGNPRWQKYINTHIKQWCSDVINVVLRDRCGRPVLVVRYEDVKNNRTAEVLRMLDFLRVTYSPVDVAQRLEEDANLFQRKHSSKFFEPYTKEKRDLVQRNLEDLIARLQHENNGNTLGIEEYLLTTA